MKMNICSFIELVPCVEFCCVFCVSRTCLFDLEIQASLSRVNLIQFIGIKRSDHLFDLNFASTFP